jgi:hypothetical protein
MTYNSNYSLYNIHLRYPYIIVHWTCLVLIIEWFDVGASMLRIVLREMHSYTMIYENSAGH